MYQSLLIDEREAALKAKLERIGVTLAAISSTLYGESFLGI